MHGLAQKIGTYISREIEKPESAVAISYGTELLLGTVFQFLIILGLAYVFKILIPVVAVLFSSVIFRIFSGGVHCTGYTRCLVLALLVYMPLGYLTKELVNFVYVTETISIGMLFILFATLKWAPAENPKHPIESRRKMHRMKFICLILFTMYFFFFLHYIN